MSRNTVAKGIAVLALAATASAPVVEADEPVPASKPWAWWDPLDLIGAEPNPIVRRKGNGVGPTYDGSSFHNSDGRIATYYEGDGPGIQVDYSYDHIVDQP